MAFESQKSWFLDSKFWIFFLFSASLIKVDDYAHFSSFIFQEIKVVNILMKTFLRLTPLLPSLFYASKQLITRASPIM